MIALKTIMGSHIRVSTQFARPSRAHQVHHTPLIFATVAWKSCLVFSVPLCFGLTYGSLLDPITILFYPHADDDLEDGAFATGTYHHAVDFVSFPNFGQSDYDLLFLRSRHVSDVYHRLLGCISHQITLHNRGDNLPSMGWPSAPRCPEVGILLATKSLGGIGVEISGNYEWIWSEGKRLWRQRVGQPPNGTHVKWRGRAEKGTIAAGARTRFVTNIVIITGTPNVQDILVHEYYLPATFALGTKLMLSLMCSPLSKMRLYASVSTICTSEPFRPHVRSLLQHSIFLSLWRKNAITFKHSPTRKA
ncbi:hypothetical protein GALMADRAFT_156166 [Galerina marginata CBS 339.88]|uniref:Uncharacterized protein n=1 Tax=Galerina marginata (strain CBS 339.88) TaxID=685588 RepID=A0A067T0T3_GALM3|nr:hypothetical protein GALMADRAFT_156166 [Galerina marginata CBS 339.88]